MNEFTHNTIAGIEYLERPGKGDVLVLLHGIGSNGRSFAPLLKHLEPERHVIAWNAPGYGSSEPLTDDWPLASSYADKLTQFLDALGLKRVFLAGHSLGALMGAAFAYANHDRVAHLVLAAPALGHGMQRGGTLSAAAQARIQDLERMGAKAFAAERAPRLVHQPEANPALVALVTDSMAKVSLPGYAQAARMLASGRLLDDVERLRVPTDIIVGADDRITPPEGAVRAHAALRGMAQGKLNIVPGAGHAIYLQAPAVFAAALNSEAVTAG